MCLFVACRRQITACSQPPRLTRTLHTCAPPPRPYLWMRMHTFPASKTRAQATVYDDMHMGDHIGTVVHFVNGETEYTKGGVRTQGGRRGIKGGHAELHCALAWL